MLDVSNLTVSFETANGGSPFIVMKDLTFKVAANEFVSILGPSGCGKTTLLRVIVGLQPADSGAIKVNDRDEYFPGKDVCLVFQSYGLFPWRTVCENIEFGLKIQGTSAEERRHVSERYIDLVGLRGFENHYPHQISGGMQQRVGLARALACQPRLLLMDEPFAAVDAQTRERLQTELLRIVDQTSSTVVFVTHSIEEAVYLGDRVLIMSSAPGSIIEEVSVRLGDKRWKSDIRLGHDFEEYVRMARQALAGGSGYADN